MRSSRFLHSSLHPRLFFFFFNDTATTEIYTLSLHDALPIYVAQVARLHRRRCAHARTGDRRQLDRKSTRLNSSHSQISYAVFCLKKKKQTQNAMTDYIMCLCKCRLAHAIASLLHLSALLQWT